MSTTHVITRLEKMGFKPHKVRGGVLLSAADANRIVSILLRLGFAAQALTTNCHPNEV